MEFFRDVEGINWILVHGLAVIFFLRKPLLYSNHYNQNFMFVGGVKKSAKNGTAGSGGEKSETKMIHAMLGLKVKHDSYADFIF